MLQSTLQSLTQTALRPMRRLRSVALVRPTLPSWRPFSTDLAGVVKAEVKTSAIDAARTLDTSAMAKGKEGGGGDSSSSPFLPMGDLSKIKDMATPEKITLLVEAFASLNIVEAMLFTEAMKKKLNMPTDVVLTTRSGYAAGPPAGAPAAAAPGAPAGAGAAAAAGAAPGGKPAAAEEKTTVDIKLKSFKAESKIKVIKEVRGVTSLGLKEAKELVESAPCTLMTKVKREDALKIVEKLKTEAQAECELV